jgi:Tfp pilus assembly protein PilF
VNEGWERYAAGDYAGARARFEAALERDPESPAALGGRGLALARLRQADAAAASFAMAIALAPEALEAFAGLALVEAAREALPAAIAPATRVLLLAPGYVHPHDPAVDARAVRLVRAQAYFRTGDFRRAAADLDLLAPDRAPHPIEPRTLLAALAAASGAGSPP